MPLVSGVDLPQAFWSSQGGSGVQSGVRGLGDTKRLGEGRREGLTSHPLAPHLHPTWFSPRLAGVSGPKVLGPSCPSPVGKMLGSPVQKPTLHRSLGTKVLLAEGEDTPFAEHCRHYEDSYRVSGPGGPVGGKGPPLPHGDAGPTWSPPPWKPALL